MRVPVTTRPAVALSASKEVIKVGSLRMRLLAGFVGLAFGLMTLGVSAAGAQAAAAPSWQLSLTSHPTSLKPGAVGGEPDYAEYYVTATNVGGAATSGTITVVDTLPNGISPEFVFGHGYGGTELPCEIQGQVATCTDPGPELPGRGLIMELGVHVDPLLSDPSVLVDQVSISGGGAPATTASTSTRISATPAPFGFIDGSPGLNARLADEDGSPATQAGSRPYQLTVEFNFPTRVGNESVGSGNIVAIDGGLRDVRTFLPKGLIVDPSATPVLCTEAQLEAFECPDASAVGLVEVQTIPLVRPGGFQNGLFNMVPSPGVAAELGFEATEGAAGVFAHIQGGVRAGDYSLSAASEDLLARFQNPIFGAQVQLWGDPSSPIHDEARGRCASISSVRPVSGECPVNPQSKPLLTAPTACGARPVIEVSADSWGHPGDFHQRAAEFSDTFGNPAPAFDECNVLPFNPTLQARPTTNSADSPSGLSVDLRVPQTSGLKERATAHLRKAVVTLPAGITLNPSSANGLAGCSSSQVGIDPSTGVANGSEPTCPDASRIGEVEVDTPLLDHALPGSVYVATPYDNPFDSLLAIYIVVNDPQSGVLIKLAGHVEPDPNTGQLVTTFDENPQLPFTDFKLDFFSGPAAVLRTPAVCGTYATTSELTPWSAPASGPPATPSDSYGIAGNCSQSEGSEPNKPEFEAGTVSPIAGKYTPFVIHLKREDGSQQFSQVTLTPPPGLVGKLAGVPYCADAALAAAAGRSGNEEKAHPDCGSASRIGTVHVAAGAGPAPYWASGTAYLAGPYKGAPLSMAIITPATAGPYDLGTVVTRVALHVDPVTTQITADADPIPHILKGIPLDVRQVDVSLDKPDFTRTGTSCDPMSVNGNLVSTLGQGVGLESRYQLGNCANLGFKPKLFTRLFGKTKRTGFPAFRAVYAAREGDANLKGLVLRFPRSEFIEQGHFRTICTRVQYAAGAGNGAECPANSVYGHVRVFTPLLDKPLEGPVFLRSSSHNLPDVVFALHGQIDAEVSTRIDSVKGGLRASLEGAPDVPVSKAILMMQGGQKGLFVNSRDICAHTYHAAVSFEAQSGAAEKLTPAFKNGKCRKAKHRRHKRHHHRGYKRAQRRSHR